MKRKFTQTLLQLPVICLLGIVPLFTACKKEKEEIFSAEIRNNVPESTIEKIRQMGVTINEGTKPPLFEGTYWLSPLVMTKTEVPEDYHQAGDIFADYKIKLYNQDNQKLTISLDSKGYNSSGGLISTSVGQNGAFISGNGHFFTIFVISNGEMTNSGSKFKMLEVYSGEITSTGIKKLQNAIVMIDNYGNVNEDLIPNDTGRAFEDKDGFSETSSAFRSASANIVTTKIPVSSHAREQAARIIIR